MNVLTPDNLHGNVRALPGRPAWLERGYEGEAEEEGQAPTRRYAKPAATGTYAYESAPVVTRKKQGEGED